MNSLGRRTDLRVRLVLVFLALLTLLPAACGNGVRSAGAGKGTEPSETADTPIVFGVTGPFPGRSGALYRSAPPRASRADGTPTDGQLV